MLLPTDFAKCVLCLENPPISKEHIFPESIGGQFKAKILCESCNHNRAAQIAAGIQKDIWYLNALTKLQEVLPDLYKRTTFKYATRTPEGIVIKSSVKNGIHKVTTIESNDGVIVADEKNTANIIKGMLSAKGLPKSEIDNWAQKSGQIPANTSIQVPAGIVVKKQEMPMLVPEIQNNGTCELASMLIGYEFLSLLVGNIIYDTYFDPIRKYLQTGQPSTIYSIEVFQTNPDTYHSRHQIDFVQEKERLIITVNFLGASVYKITFSGFVWQIKDICFIEDIGQKKSLIALSHDDARKGNIHDISTLLGDDSQSDSATLYQV
ncbi:MAG: HNH endonuclease [Candidatus Omnitrophota bacterium]